MEEENRGSKIKGILTVLLMLVAIGLLMIYWFFPYSNFEDAKIQNTINTNNFTDNSNFTMNESNSLLQFYPNLRYRDKEISYIIDSSCSLEKKDEMLRAMKIIENRSVIDFYSLSENQKGQEEIHIACEDKNVEKGGLFVAGEGGPVKIAKSGKYNVINKGSILLIRESSCAEPLIALHELLHALGFDHSENQKNIMYRVSKCYQEMGDEIPDEINELYATPSRPDLTFESVSAKTHNRYLDFNISVRNRGLASSDSESKINVLINNKSIKEIELDSLEPGEGTKYMSKNTLIKQLNINELKFSIESPVEELNTTNNEITITP